MATKKKERPIILITNDDGITAPGIRALVEAAKPLGKVVVVAPDKPQSGMGHAITIGTPLRMSEERVRVKRVTRVRLSARVESKVRRSVKLLRRSMVATVWLLVHDVIGRAAPDW